MSSIGSNMPSGAAHRWLALVLLLSLCINCAGIRWGLPNTEGTWAADSLPPTAPMAIAKHFFAGDAANSGWFYFKYPLGHPLLLLAAQAPYLAWLRLTGEFRAPASTYPYGFHHPEHALFVLALVMRVVSALMGVGVVALTYVIAADLFGALAGLAAAVLVSGSYPLVFYAHTANVDVPLLFWMALALVAALRCARDDSTVMAALTGVAVAMALLTKEQSMGIVAVIPVVWAVRRWGGGQRTWKGAIRHALVAGVAFAAVTFVVGNLWWNPAGYLNRWRFLMGTLPPEVRAKYAPYQFLLQVPKGASLTRELEHVRKVVGTAAHALTFPVVGLSLVGLAWALWRRPNSATILLLLIASYYMISLRAVVLIPVRYTIPLLYCVLILAGAGFAAILQGGSERFGRRGRAAVGMAVMAAWACALLPGAEIDRLLLKDPRYAAEAWLRAHAAAKDRVEIYESLTYLPRFGDNLQVVQVPMDERTVEGLQQRRPDFVVLSSGGQAGLTGQHVRDWHPGEPVFAESPAAVELMDRLRSEQLGYRRVAQFHTPNGWVTPRINSLNPEITIYGPDARAEARAQ